MPRGGTETASTPPSSSSCSVSAVISVSHPFPGHCLPLLLLRAARCFEFVLYLKDAVTSPSGKSHFCFHTGEQSGGVSFGPRFEKLVPLYGRLIRVPARIATERPSSVRRGPGREPARETQRDLPAPLYSAFIPAAAPGYLIPFLLFDRSRSSNSAARASGSGRSAL